MARTGYSPPTPVATQELLAPTGRAAGRALYRQSDLDADGYQQANRTASATILGDSWRATRRIRRAGDFPRERRSGRSDQERTGRRHRHERATAARARHGFQPNRCRSSSDISCRRGHPSSAPTSWTRPESVSVSPREARPTRPLPATSRTRRSFPQKTSMSGRNVDRGTLHLCHQQALAIRNVGAMPGSRILDGKWGVEQLAMAIPKGRDQGMQFVADFQAVQSNGVLARI